MNTKFLTVEKSLSGYYYVCLADDAGPIERFDIDEYSTYDAAAERCRELARVNLVKCVV